jgi:iron(III) transport system ATP-binding protein
VIAQINTPSSLYSLPRDAELAQFLGEANLVEGTVSGKTVQTALGDLAMAAGPAPSAGPVRVMVRPEQLILGDAATPGVSSVVRSYEYFGHDAVVRVLPENGGLPELVVRITGGAPLVPGTRVGVSVHGAVMVWPTGDREPRPGAWESERERITHA